MEGGLGKVLEFLPHSQSCNGCHAIVANGLIPVLNASLDSVGDILPLLLHVNKTCVWIAPFEDSVEGNG